MPSGGRKSYGAQLVIRVPKELMSKLKEEAELFEMSVSDLSRMTLSAMFLEDAEKPELVKAFNRRLEALRAKLKRR